MGMKNCEDNSGNNRAEKLDENNDDDGHLPRYNPSQSQPKRLQPPLLMVHSVTEQQQPWEEWRRDRRSRRGRQGEGIMGLRD